MSRSVLIVDDDPFIRKLIATTLEDVAGFELVEAADGVEAVDYATANPPAIVFLDVNMPRLDGIGAAAQLRALPGTEATTIVMLTAAGAEREVSDEVARAVAFAEASTDEPVEQLTRFVYSEANAS